MGERPHAGFSGKGTIGRGTAGRLPSSKIRCLMATALGLRGNREEKGQVPPLGYARSGDNSVAVTWSISRQMNGRLWSHRIVIPTGAHPGFPATRHLPAATCAAFSKESRMKLADATKLHRKSGGA